MVHKLFWRLAASFLLLGCDTDQQSNSESNELGTVTLQLRSNDGTHELSGSITFERTESPGFSYTEDLSGTTGSINIALPEGSYSAVLDEGWRLVRFNGTLTEDITHLVTTVWYQPSSVAVEADKVSSLLIVFFLDDDTVVALGAGSVDVTMGVDDEGLLCGGCPVDQICLSYGGDYSCVTPCDPTGDDEQCGPTAECSLLYYVPDGSSLSPLYVCQDLIPIVDQTHNLPVDVDFCSNINASYRYSGQTFTAGVDGFLVGVSVSIDSIEDVEGIPLRIALRRAPGGVPEPTTLTETVWTSGSANLREIITFPDDIRQTTGEMFAIIADYPDAPPPGPGMIQGSWWGNTGSSNGDLYPEGAMIYGTDGVTWYERENHTLVFQTWVIPD